ncbi:dTDP-4-dehydrorhamnose 3,5-epimerase family protein [Streptomyces sp. NPDC057638]|uniref:dTDP-4-dehydrorhamnose 3,5-epimerase family protein n=1 Tax=Streptomyces sp. NPDC057638 TaxID=3346190 RepID=UPI0036BDDFC5
MHWHALGVSGAYAFTPDVYPDQRGLFVSPFQADGFTRATGRRMFRPTLTGHSRNRRGVIRGVHFTTTPPGMATYVSCARGSALDFVVDLRVGSPTFGRWDSVVLDAEKFHSVYLPVGLGHAFQALEDDTVVSYLLSGGYVPEHERAVSVFDPELGLPLREDIPPVLSPRDSSALSLAETRERGLLPDYATCLRLDAELGGGPATESGDGEGDHHD